MSPSRDIYIHADPQPHCNLTLGRGIWGISSSGTGRALVALTSSSRIRRWDIPLHSILVISPEVLWIKSAHGTWGYSSLCSGFTRVTTKSTSSLWNFNVGKFHLLKWFKPTNLRLTALVIIKTSSFFTVDGSLYAVVESPATRFNRATCLKILWPGKPFKYSLRALLDMFCGLCFCVCVLVWWIL